MERTIVPTIHLPKNRARYSNSSLAGENIASTAGPLQTTDSGKILMLPGTLTQLCWRGSEYHEIVSSICVAHLHSCKTCMMGCETGVCTPGMCARNSSVLLRVLHLAWRRLITLLTYHKGHPALAPSLI